MLNITYTIYMRVFCMDSVVKEIAATHFGYDKVHGHTNEIVFYLANGNFHLFSKC